VEVGSKDGQLRKIALLQKIPAKNKGSLLIDELKRGEKKAEVVAVF